MHSGKIHLGNMCGRHDTTISLAYLFEKEMSQKEINDWDVP
jgi:hypothetical protein